MLKRLYLLCLILMTFPVLAQTETRVGNWDYVSPRATPFNPIADKNTYGIKAKLLPYTIANEFGSYSSIGTEIGFFKNQSLTVEWFFNYNQHSYDAVIDIYGNEHESGNRNHMNEHALQIGYRYYYGFQKWRRDWRMAFYNGVFGRAEQDKIYMDPHFDNDYFNKTAKVRAFGILTGVTQKFSPVSHFGMDYNVSLGRSFTESEYVKRNDTGYYTEKKNYNSFYFNLGISLNYYF